MVSNNVIIVLVAMLIISTISTTYGVNMKHINSHHNKNHKINSHANNHNKVAVGINSKAHANTKLEKLHNIAKQHAKASSLKNVVEAKLPKHHMQLTHTSLVELNSKTT
jgi:cell division protein FtsL